MGSLARYNKAAVVVVLTILSAILAANSDNGLSRVEWVNVTISGVTAVSVWLVSNTVETPATKAWIAALLGVLQLLSTLILGHIGTNEIIQLILAGAAAAGVYGVPNRDGGVRRASMRPTHLG